MDGVTGGCSNEHVNENLVKINIGIKKLVWLTFKINFDQNTNKATHLASPECIQLKDVYYLLV